MKYTILFLTLLISLKSFSQRQFVDDLDTLYFKNGKFLIGEFKDSRRLFCTGDKKNNCEKYSKNELDRKIIGISAKDKKWYIKKGMNIPNASVYKNLKIRDLLDNEDVSKNVKLIFFPRFTYKGSNYDFYSGSLHSFESNANYTFITESDSDIVIARIRQGFKSDKKSLQNALEVTYEKCSAISDALKQKKYKKEDFNIYQVLDECGKISIE